MSLLALIVLLALVGVALYFVNTLPWIDPKIRKIINVVVVIAVILWLLKAFGVWAEIRDIKI